ncbi:MAG: MFS transporter [Anaerolineaceae bacterium]|nr:MFS transporter [Anaerolineaceae bacterium]
MDTKSEKLTFWQKLGYGLGDIFGGGSGTLISFYYLVFLTDVVRISPGLAGTVVLISKVYDSVTDPFEGVLSDHTRTRLGRRRPYLLAGILFIFLSFFAMFYPVNYESERARFAFVILTYLFFSTVVSIVMLNYNALQAELSLDYNERTSLTTFRIFFSTFSSILCALLPLQIVSLFPDVRTGWIATAAIFGLLFSLPFIATVVVTRERPEFQKKPQPFHWKQAFIEPFQVRTFVYVLVMYVTAFTAFDATSSIVVYFAKSYLGRAGEVSYVLGGLLISQVIALPFYQWLSKRTSKSRAYIVGASLFVLVMFFSFLITPTSPPFALYLFAAMVGLGAGGVVVMVYAIFPDIPDVDELRSGERREGIYAALTTFARKISSAIAVFAVAQVLELAGYIPPLEVAGQLVEQPQNASFLLALRIVFVLLPVALISFGIFFAARFPLTVPLYRRLEKVLAAARSGDAVDENEKQALSRQLIGS